MPRQREQLRMRREVIKEILRREEIHTQIDLMQRLKEKDYRVTQSSVSRDLQEIDVVRVDGRYLPLEDVGGAGQALARLGELASYILSCAPAGPYLLVLKTPPGLATSVALALDQAAWPESAGTVAGDDTIFLALAGRLQQARLEARIAALMRRATHD